MVLLAFALYDQQVNILLVNSIPRLMHRSIAYNIFEGNVLLYFVYIK